MSVTRRNAIRTPCATELIDPGLPIGLVVLGSVVIGSFNFGPLEIFGFATLQPFRSVPNVRGKNFLEDSVKIWSLSN